MQHAEAVGHRAAEIDRRCLVEVLGGTADLPEAHPLVLHLREDLIVEDEIVAVFVIIDGLKGSPAVGAVAGVVLGEFLSEQQVLDEREDAVRHVLVDGHPSGHGVLREDARPEAHIIHARCDHRGHGRHEARLVLVIGMEHDHDVGPALEGDVVTTFLIATITLVRVVPHAMDTEFLSQGEGIVAAVVVDQYHIVHHIHRDGSDRGTQCLRSVVSGKDDSEAQDSFVVCCLWCERR